MARAGARRRPLLDRLPRPLHHDAGREMEPQEPSARDSARHAQGAGAPRSAWTRLDTARRLAAERDASQSRSCCAGWASPSTRADGPLRSAVGSDGLTVCSPWETRVRVMEAITATCASTASRAPFLTFAPSRQAASPAAGTTISADSCPISPGVLPSGFLPTPPHGDAVAFGLESGAPPPPPGDSHPQALARAGRTARGEGGALTP